MQAFMVESQKYNQSRLRISNLTISVRLPLQSIQAGENPKRRTALVRNMLYAQQATSHQDSIDPQSLGYNNKYASPMHSPASP